MEPDVYFVSGEGPWAHRRLHDIVQPAVQVLRNPHTTGIHEQASVLGVNKNGELLADLVSRASIQVFAPSVRRDDGGAPNAVGALVDRAVAVGSPTTHALPLASWRCCDRL